MAVKKAAGGKKSSKAGSASKTKAGAKGAVKKAAPKKGAATKAAAPKKAAVKKKAGAAPVKLSTSQTDLLKKVHGAPDPAGYRPEKKEQRTADSLHEKKLLKRGAKHKESGTYHYQVSNTGKKHVETHPNAPISAPSTGSSTGGSMGGTPPASGS
jgi:hypothetical protein